MKTNLGDRTFNDMTRLGEGMNGIVYDLHTDFNGSPAAAKTWKSGNAHAHELDMTTLVGQFPGSGNSQEDNGHERFWMIIKKVPKHLKHFKEIAKDSDHDHCKDVLLERAKGRVEEAVLHHVKSDGVEQLDPIPGNVFLSDDFQEAMIVDWGKAKRHADMVGV